MKNLSKSFLLCAFAGMLLAASGCVQDHYTTSTISRAPYIGAAEWLNWVDLKVDTRYANGNRPEPGSKEWYAIVDHVVFTDPSRDYYRAIYRRQYEEDYRRYYRVRNAPTRRYASNYYGPARFSRADSDYLSSTGYKLGTVEWRREVTTIILAGKVPPPPPRSDPWDTPLAPASDR